MRRPSRLRNGTDRAVGVNRRAIGDGHRHRLDIAACRSDLGFGDFSGGAVAASGLPQVLLKETVMPVYVDNMRAPYRGMILCHMVADTTAELLAMADRIGMQRRWIQKAGTRHEHFDISLEMRAKAVRAGAVEIDRRQLGEILAARRASAVKDRG